MIKNEAAATHIRKTVYELTEFLVVVLKVEKLDAKFPHKVGMHQSCHGQRGLHLSQMSELVAPGYSKPGYLLDMVEGLELISLNRVMNAVVLAEHFAWWKKP
jgi:L-lactate dehydrogenase complex protein LldE